MNVFTTLTTGGDSLWSTRQADVAITQLRLQYCNPEKSFGELCVHFDPLSWNCATDGLIYTDTQFLYELRQYLISLGFSEAEALDVNYSEQGMQDDEYVSCDVGAVFLAGLERMDPQHVHDIWLECIDV